MVGDVECCVRVNETYTYSLVVPNPYISHIIPLEDNNRDDVYSVVICMHYSQWTCNRMIYTLSCK